MRTPYVLSCTAAAWRGYLTMIWGFVKHGSFFCPEPDRDSSSDLTVTRQQKARHVWTGQNRCS